MKTRGETKGPQLGMLRLQMLLAYDGGAFEGWQSQPSGQTVQDTLEKAVSALVGQFCPVHGSGRTDSGVHAMGQVAHVDVPEGRLPVSAWEGALNGHLPQAVRVIKVKQAANGFHARFSACGKIYWYRVWNARSMHPLEIGRAWHVPSSLDLGCLQAAAQRLTGRHDFAGFAANRGRPEDSTVRTIHRIAVERKEALVTLKFEGEGFLYRMVRMLSGSMIRVAQGKESLEWLGRFLEQPQAGRTSYCAPADGLYLDKVLYKAPRHFRSFPPLSPKRSE